MKYMLYKSSASISISYRNGNYTNNITGSFFSIEGKCDHIIFTLDLSENLRGRNKEASNNYIDACELIDDYSLVKIIQISTGPQTLRRLKSYPLPNPDAPIFLNLHLGDNHIFAFPVSIALGDGEFICTVLPCDDLIPSKG